jgi:hypothetical protein
MSPASCSRASNPSPRRGERTLAQGEVRPRGPTPRAPLALSAGAALAGRQELPAPLPGVLDLGGR